MIASKLAQQVLSKSRQFNLKIATVESCTGGLISAALTDISGSSDVVDCGFITYSNSAKINLVGVPENILTKYGAVSRQTALKMAEGGLKYSIADLAIAVTGIAGPDSDDSAKPVGLVHLAVVHKNSEPLHYEAHFGNIGRESVRFATVNKALELILEKIENNIEI